MADTIDCSPAAVAEAAKCFCIYDDQQQAAVELYLLARLAGGSMDPKTLMAEAAAAGFMGIQDKQMQEGLKILLLCNAVNAA